MQVGLIGIARGRGKGAPGANLSDGRLEAVNGGQLLGPIAKDPSAEAPQRALGHMKASGDFRDRNPLPGGIIQSDGQRNLRRMGGARVQQPSGQGGQRLRG